MVETKESCHQRSYRVSERTCHCLCYILYIYHFSLNLFPMSRAAVNLIYINSLRNNIHRPPCMPDSLLYSEFESRFPFAPTADQLISFADISYDMVNRTRPMDRLICGDVGFGKTEVAIRAIYRAVLNGRQVAFLAPTRVLAQQHARSLSNRLPGVVVKLLRGGGGAEANTTKRELMDGTCQVGRASLTLQCVAIDLHSCTGGYRNPCGAVEEHHIPQSRPVGYRRGAAVRRRPEGVYQDCGQRSRRAHTQRHAHSPVPADRIERIQGNEPY